MSTSSSHGGGGMAVDAGMADLAQRDAGARKLSFLGPAMETLGVHEIHARILSRRIASYQFLFFLEIKIQASITVSVQYYIYHLYMVYIII